MKTLLSIAGAGEAAMGLALIVYPAIVVRLLFGAEIAGVGIVMSRFAGISLVGLGLACWAGSASVRVLNVMLIYSALATLYLSLLGVQGSWIGKLLWPALAVHLVLTVLLAVAWHIGHKDLRQLRR